MTGATAPAAEAILNADGELLVVGSHPAGEATGWDRGPGPLLRIRMRDGTEVAMTLSEEALDAAVSSRRLLLVEAGEDGHPASERWIFQT